VLKQTITEHRDMCGASDIRYYEDPKDKTRGYDLPNFTPNYSLDAQNCQDWMKETYLSSDTHDSSSF
jgi:hypothetical protein